MLSGVVEVSIKCLDYLKRLTEKLITCDKVARKKIKNIISDLCEGDENKSAETVDGN